MATGGLRSIEPNKAASIGASPQVAAGSIIGRHEPPLDNEPADAPLRGFRSPILKRIRCLRARRRPLPSTGIVPHAPLSLFLSLPTRSDDCCRALLRNFTQHFRWSRDRGMREPRVAGPTIGYVSRWRNEYLLKYRLRYAARV